MSFNVLYTPEADKRTAWGSGAVHVCWSAARLQSHGCLMALPEVAFQENAPELGHLLTAGALSRARSSGPFATRSMHVGLRCLLNGSAGRLAASDITHLLLTTTGVIVPQHHRLHSVNR